jgi:glucoside 3-dehydrogenase (cytochrome c) hitch-hiker subunit
MDRRQLLALIAAATGCAFIEGCKPKAVSAEASFTPEDVAFFDEVAETILPRTDTPGAKDAKTGAFIATYSEATYEPEQLAILKSGIGALNAEVQKRFGADFMQATPQQRTAALTEIDREARRYNQAPGHEKDGKAPHWFTLMKQLTLYGFFTSEPGATKVARYRPVPGKYKGVIDYKPGEAFWAWA